MHSNNNKISYRTLMEIREEISKSVAKFKDNHFKIVEKREGSSILKIKDQVQTSFKSKEGPKTGRKAKMVKEKIIREKTQLKDSYRGLIKLIRKRKIHKIIRKNKDYKKRKN